MTVTTQLKVQDFTKVISRQVNATADQVMHLITLDITNRALDLVTANTVTDGQSGAFLGRSEAGDPPYQDTSRLADSIPEARQVFRQGDQVIGLVGTTVEYGAYLELGTRRMKARPFLRPAFTASVAGGLAGKVRRKFGGRA